MSAQREPSRFDYLDSCAVLVLGACCAGLVAGVLIGAWFLRTFGFC
jgi:hypothetical protein